jgi:hypothetical protein
LRCLALDGDVLVIKIRTFAGAHAAEDAATLRQCFESGSFRKVIFDVRGNTAAKFGVIPTISLPRSSANR